MKDIDLRDLDAYRAALEQRVSVSSCSERRRAARGPPDEPHHAQRRVHGSLPVLGPAISDVGAALDQVRSLRGVPARAVCASMRRRRRSIRRHGADGRAVSRGASADRSRQRSTSSRTAFAWRSLRRTSGAGHDRGPARSAATLCGGGVAAICRPAWPGRTPKDLLHHVGIRIRSLCAIRDWGVREWPCRQGLANGAADREQLRAGELRSMGSASGRPWPRVSDKVKSGELVSVLEDVRGSVFVLSGLMLSRRVRGVCCGSGGNRSEEGEDAVILPSPGRVDLHEAQRNVSWGGVKVHQLAHCWRGETVTPPRRFASTLPLQGRVSINASISHSMLQHAVRRWWLSRKVRTSMITFSPISTRPSMVAEPMCGSSVALPAPGRTSFGIDRRLVLVDVVPRHVAGFDQA